jgi:hypothetical protein
VNDPFDVLRRPPEYAAVRSGPDESFRAALLAEARRRLNTEVDDDGARARHGDGPDTPTLLEPITGPATTITSLRPLVLAAACVILVATGFGAMVALTGRADPDGDAAPVDVGRAGGVETTSPTTTTRSTTAAPTTAAPTIAAPTTAPPAAGAPDHDLVPPAGPDDILASAALLDDAYAVVGFSPMPRGSGPVVGFDPLRSREVAACEPFQESVFGAFFQAATASRSFTVMDRDVVRRQDQFVAVFAENAQAETAFAALSDPEFAGCARAVAAASVETVLPTGLVEGRLADLPIASIDTAALRSLTWTAQDGSSYVAALVRHGRMIGYVDAPGPTNGAPADLPVAEFEAILASVVEEYTLGEIDLGAVESVLLPADEYGVGWAATPVTTNLGSEFVPAYARAIPECAAFVASVFETIYELPHAMSLYYRPYPEAAIGQYVVLFPDDASAASMMNTLHSAAFAPCATAYQRYVLGSNCCDGGPLLPAPFDQPAARPPAVIGDQLVYRRYEASWIGQNDEVHGPELLLDASLRVGRVISFVGTLGEGDGTGDGGRDVVVTTDQQFADTLSNIERRARAALAGTPSSG